MKESNTTKFLILVIACSVGTKDGFFGAIALWVLYIIVMFILMEMGAPVGNNSTKPEKPQ